MSSSLTSQVSQSLLLSRQLGNLTTHWHIQKKSSGKTTRNTFVAPIPCIICISYLRQYYFQSTNTPLLSSSMMPHPQVRQTTRITIHTFLVDRLIFVESHVSVSVKPLGIFTNIPRCHIRGSHTPQQLGLVPIIIFLVIHTFLAKSFSFWKSCTHVCLFNSGRIFLRCGQYYDVRWSSMPQHL